MHTNKLKRKLADLVSRGAIPNSQNPFASSVAWSWRHPARLTSVLQIGTPLPPLEKTKDSGEFVPLWKQDVIRLPLSGLSSDPLSRSETRRVEEDFMARSLVVSQPATSTPSAPPRVCSTPLLSQPRFICFSKDGLPQLSSPPEAIGRSRKVPVQRTSWTMKISRSSRTVRSWLT